MGVRGILFSGQHHTVEIENIKKMPKGSEMASSKTRTEQCIKGISYSTVLVAFLVVGGAYVYFDRTSSLNKFSAAVTETLCDMLPNRGLKKSATPPVEEEAVATPTTPKIQPSKSSAHNPKLVNGASYDAKAAMQMRFENLHDMCNRYSDVMRPESLMTKTTSQRPKKEGFYWNPSLGIAFCSATGIGQKGMAALFERLKSSDVMENAAREALAENYENASKNYKKAIMVRHPMERLLSVYRKHFAAYTDPSKGEVDEKAVSFSDFIHLVVQGPKELADFISENKLHGESLGMDTGMVDGKGESSKWDSYWHQCGLCHPDFRPHYILDFEHAKEDQAVLIELMGNKETALKWLEVKRNSIVSREDVIQHFYSQLTKTEIRGIYEKYRVDFELFGYSPDYFLQFGSEE